MDKKLPKKYVPDSLSKEDKKKQIKSIKSGTLEDRPKVDYPTRRSQYVIKFEKKYNRKITDLDFIYKNLISKTGVEKIFDKALAAYASGSRPNVTASAWKYARLASVLVGGPAERIDKDILNKYKK